MAWDSDLYLKFANERKQPCIDLSARLDGDFSRILDLGCGPGNSTENLFKKFGNAEIIGFDADDNMLNKAKTKHPDLIFVKGFAPTDFNKLSGKFDLVFSNACIHWIPNQAALIDGVYDMLTDGGEFAVQIPLTGESHFYRILYRLINEKYPKLKEINNFHNLNEEGYCNALNKKFREVTVWRTDYYHTVKKEDVLEWYKGSGLRPYLEKLDKCEKEAFLRDLQDAVNEEYKPLDNGLVFLIMPRLFFTAKK